MWGFNSPTSLVYSISGNNGMDGFLLGATGDLDPIPQG